MKNKVYMIEILCKDTDTTIYNDNYRIGYATYEIAKKNLNRLIEEEYRDLLSMADDKRHYSIIDYIEDKEERYEREIHIETEDYEDFLTRYTIVIVEVEDINTRYDEEENFPIDDELAQKISGMVYKGIEVEYVYDTNTIIYCKANQSSKRDEYDYACDIYRNYTEEYLKHFIDTELKKYIDEKGDE